MTLCFIPLLMSMDLYNFYQFWASGPSCDLVICWWRGSSCCCLGKCMHAVISLKEREEDLPSLTFTNKSCKDTWFKNQKSLQEFVSEI